MKKKGIEMDRWTSRDLFLIMLFLLSFMVAALLAFAIDAFALVTVNVECGEKFAGQDVELQITARPFYSSSVYYATNLESTTLTVQPSNRNPEIVYLNARADESGNAWAKVNASNVMAEATCEGFARTSGNTQLYAAGLAMGFIILFLLMKVIG
jgi:hypothetical protein